MAPISPRHRADAHVDEAATTFAPYLGEVYRANTGPSLEADCTEDIRLAVDHIVAAATARMRRTLTMRRPGRPVLPRRR